LNSKRRTIWHVSGTNKFVAKAESGKMVYGPKARYVKSPGGSERLITNTKARPPKALRPKARRMRINRGMKRGAHAGPHVGNLGRLFASPKHANKTLSPIGLAGMKVMIRKRRSNKGGKRGPRNAMGLKKLFGM
jgi:hypothetical protein